MPAPPGRNVLDDEEVFPGPDVAERPRLGGERGERRGVAETLLEGGLLLPQLLHRCDPDSALGAGVEIVVQWSVVEEPNEQERTDREPSAGNGATETPAALLPCSHPARVLGPERVPC